MQTLLRTRGWGSSRPGRLGVGDVRRNPPGRSRSPCRLAGVVARFAPRRRWRRSKAPGPSMNLSLTLQSIARRLPGQTALTAEGTSLGYAGFEDQVQRIAGALRGRFGLAPGDRVALAMENCAEYLPALYGIWRAGLSAVPMNSKLHAKEMAWILF